MGMDLNTAPGSPNAQSISSVQGVITSAREAIANGATDEAVQIMVAAAQVAQERGFSGQALELVTALEQLMNVPGLPDRDRAEVLAQKGTTQVWQGLLSEARESFSEVLQIAELLDDATLRARALRGIGLHFHFQGDYLRARDLYEQAIRVISTTNEPDLTFKVRFDLLSLAFEEEDFTRARQLLEELGASPVPKAALPFELMIRGGLAVENGELDQAESYFRRVLRAARRSNTVALEVRAMRELGNIRLREARPGVAVRWFRNALRRTKLLGVFPEEVGIRLSFAHALRLLGRLAEAAEELQTAQSLATRVQDRRGLARATAVLGELQFELLELETAESLLRQAAELFLELHDTSAFVQSSQSLAEAQIGMGDMTAAIRSLDRAIDNLPDGPNMERVTLLHRAGQALISSLDSSDRAARYFARAALAAEEVGDPQAIFGQAFFAGTGLVASGRTKEAIQFFDRAVDAAESVGDHQMMFQSRSSRGISLTSDSRFEEARADFEQCLDLARLSNDRAMASIARLHLGTLDRQIQKPFESQRQLEFALSGARELGNQLLEARILLELAWTYLEQQNWQEAEAHFRQAGSLSFDLNLFETDMRAAAGLGIMAYGSQHYIDAMRFFRRATSLGLNFAGPDELANYLIRFSESLLIANRERSLVKEIKLLLKSAVDERSRLLGSFAFAQAGEWWLNQGRAEETAQNYAASLYLSLTAVHADETQSSAIIRRFIKQSAENVNLRVRTGTKAFYDKVLLALESDFKGINKDLREQITSETIALLA
jgi:tetratricopeptide (TPR) repeat protein